MAHTALELEMWRRDADVARPEPPRTPAAMTFPDQPGPRIRTGWRARIRACLRVLWVCRVSLVSVVAGFCLFVFVQQVHDLFRDFPIADSQIVDNERRETPKYGVIALHALGFGLITLFLWAIPVHSAARFAVSKRDWLRPRNGAELDDATERALRESHAQAIIWVPRALGAATFLGVFAALSASYASMFGEQSNIVAIVAKPATIVYMAVVFGCGLLFMIYCLGRRAVLNRLFADGSEPMSQAPASAPDKPVVMHRAVDLRIERRVLYGIFAVQLVLLAAPALLEPYFPRLYLLPVVLGVWVPLLAWLARRSHAAGLPIIVLALVALALVNFVAGDRDETTVVAVGDQGAPQLTLNDAVRMWREANNCADDIGLCPSPIIVSTAGGASRAGYFTVSALGLMLDATCGPQAAGIAARIKDEFANSEPCPELPEFGKRLFAISSVSGGSIGAAVFARALVDGATATDVTAPCRYRVTTTLWAGGDRPGGWRGCLQAIMAEDFLTPVVAGLAFRDAFSFLSRWLPEGAWPNRGDRLENAMAEAYRRFVHPDEPAVGKDGRRTGLEAGFGALAPRAGANVPWRPLLLLNTTHVESGRRAIISHLAPCYTAESGSRASSGAPIRLFTDAYDIHDWLAAGGAPHRSCVLQGANAAKPELDLSLVAAAHDSARFPLISPSGALPRDGRLHARLVDGGYFENYGASSVYDLVDALMYDFRLRPFVVQITNDPADDPETRPHTPWSALPPPKVEPPQTRLIDTLMSVVDTVMNTRSGRGTHAVRAVGQLLHPGINGDLRADIERIAAKGAAAPYFGACLGMLANLAQASTDELSLADEGCFTHIRVPRRATDDRNKEIDSARSRPVSMSWWLSKPVQEYVDDMLICRNRNALDRLCRVTTRSPDRSITAKHYEHCQKVLERQRKAVCPDTDPRAQPVAAPPPRVAAPPAAPAPPAAAPAPPAAAPQQAPRWKKAELSRRG